jgi:hypothetical protein
MTFPLRGEFSRNRLQDATTLHCIPDQLQTATTRNEVMTTCEAPRKKHRPVRSEILTESLPPKPDKQLWKTDKARAFEAGVQWFLAVSRSA